MSVQVMHMAHLMQCNYQSPVLFVKPEYIDHDDLRVGGPQFLFPGAGIIE